MEEEVIAALVVKGLATYVDNMQTASKATTGVGDASKATSKDVSSSSKSMSSSTGSVVTKLAAAAAASAVAKKGFDFLKGAAQDAGGLAKQTRGLQRITGADAKTASAWVSMTKERGIQGAQLTKGFVTLNKQLTGAAGGSKTAAKSFAQLGLDANVLMALPTDLRMGMIADSFKALPDGVDKAAAAQKLFGRQATSLLPILNGGAKGIKATSDELAKYGQVIDQRGVDKSLKLAATQREMGRAMTGVKMAIGTALIPILSDLAKALLPIAQGFAQALAKWPALGPVILGLAAAFAALMIVSQVAAAFALVANPVGLIVIGIAALAAGLVVLYTQVGWFRDGVNAAFAGVVAAFNWVKDAAVNVFNWIKQNWPLLLVILTGPFGLFITIVTGHFGQLKSSASATISAVAGFFLSLPGKLASVGLALVNVIIGPLKSLPAKAGEIGKSIVQAIASGIASAPGAILNAIESVLPGPLKKAAGGVAGVLSKIAATGTVMAAQGGATTGAGSTVLVGERGPELATMPSGARITPMPPPMLSPSQMGTGGGGTHISQVFLEKRMIAEAVADYAGEQQAAR